MTPNQRSSREMEVQQQVLPDELLEIICLEAAAQDRHSAYALAFVCHRFCQWTAKARWKTVVLRSRRQLLSFWKAIYAVPDEIYDVLKPFYGPSPSIPESLSDEQSRKRSEYFEQLSRNETIALESENRLIRGLSYPADGKPHKYVRNLFVDIPSAQSPRDVDRYNGLHAGSAILSGSSIPSDPFKILHRWTCRDKSVLQQVSLGVNETNRINWSALDGIDIRELTIVLENDYLGDLHVDMTPSIERIHIVGYDSKAELAGIEPPWTLLKTLCSPYLPSAAGAAPCLSNRRLTHVRYDTRRFSFKPAEIFAKRLRPLLQELTIAPRSPPFDIPTSTQAFQHNGPRHAAPQRGAGSFLLHQKAARLRPVSQIAAEDVRKEEAAAQFLSQIGVGQLRLVKFAWDPLKADLSEQDGHIPWYKRYFDGERDTLPKEERDSQSSQEKKPQTYDEILALNGGWPREARGAWAEIAESRGSGSSKKNLSASFAVELRDAISTLYGWHAPDIEAAGKFSARIDREAGADENGSRKAYNVAFSAEESGLVVEPAQAGLTAADQGELRLMSHLIKLNFPESWRSSHPEWQEDDVDFLRFGIRAPRSLIHLGGEDAAFTVDDRLYLFEQRSYGGQGAWP